MDNTNVGVVDVDVTSESANLRNSKDTTIVATLDEQSVAGFEIVAALASKDQTCTDKRETKQQQKKKSTTTNRCRSLPS